MLGILSGVLGFTKANKLLLHVVAVGSLVTIIGFYVIHTGSLKETNELLRERIDILRQTTAVQEQELKNRNSRIAQANTEKLEAIDEMRQTLLELEIQAKALRTERDALETELAETRFETIEAIRDDEEFADWVDWPVPAAGWRLLREASEGTGTP